MKLENDARLLFPLLQNARKIFIFIFDNNFFRLEKCIPKWRYRKLPLHTQR